MQKKIIFIAFLFSFLFSFLFYHLLAQDTFNKKDIDFFKAQSSEITKWFTHFGFSITDKNINIVVDKSNQKKEYVILYVSISSGGDWLKLQEVYAKKSKGGSLEKDLWNKLIFLCEISASQALVCIKTENDNSLWAGLDIDEKNKENFIIEYKNKENKKDENQSFLKEQTRAAVNYNFSVPIAISNTSNEKSIDIYKSKIIQFLRNYYQKKGTSYCGKSIFEVIDLLIRLNWLF